jgi:hypothetical protein
LTAGDCVVPFDLDYTTKGKQTVGRTIKRSRAQAKLILNQLRERILSLNQGPMRVDKKALRKEAEDLIAASSVRIKKLAADYKKPQVKIRTTSY